MNSIALTLCLAMVACSQTEPVWAYRELRETVQVDKHVALGLRVNASVFAGGLTLAIEAKNNAQQPIAVDFAGVAVRNARGMVLRRRQERALSIRCDSGQSEAMLSPQRSCQSTHGLINIHPRVLDRPNPDLATLTVTFSVRSPPEAAASVVRLSLERE